VQPRPKASSRYFSARNSSGVERNVSSRKAVNKVPIMIALWVAKLFSYSEIAPAPIVPVGFLPATGVGLVRDVLPAPQVYKFFPEPFSLFSDLPAG
jgi:hypothetical protein